MIHQDKKNKEKHRIMLFNEKDLMGYESSRLQMDQKDLNKLIKLKFN